MHTHARAGRPSDSNTAPPRLVSVFGPVSGLLHEPTEKPGIGYRFHDQSIPQCSYERPKRCDAGERGVGTSLITQNVL